MKLSEAMKALEDGKSISVEYAKGSFKYYKMVNIDGKDRVLKWYDNSFEIDCSENMVLDLDGKFTIKGDAK